MNSYERFCFNLIGNRMTERRSEFLNLRNDMMGARMRTPFEAYLATAFITRYLVGIIAGILIGFMAWVFRLPEAISYKGALPEFIVGLSDWRLLIGTIVIMVVSILVFGGITYLVFLIYPGIIAGERRRNIDATLPYAINYITAMSTAGITPAEIFRLLGESAIYGESAVEARYIAREIDIFGKDLIDALRIVGIYTPSARMKDFLQGAMASISSGSNLTEYFRAKSSQYSLENRQEQKTFLETLGLIAESYVTALVAGSLFLIILQAIMSVISGESDPLLLYVIIYGIIPFGSIMFIVLISSMTPEV